MTKLFLHGLGQNASSWNQTLQSIPDAIALELNDLIKGKEAMYSVLYEAFSKECQTIAKPLHLCGLSLGAILAMHYAIDHPDHVASLILIAGQYKMPKNMLKLQSAIFHIMPSKSFTSMGFSKKDFIKLTSSMAELDFANDLHRITCPALILCGEKDKTNQKAAKALSENIPHARLALIKDAGHEVNLDTPETLAKEILTFYEKYTIK